MRSVVMCMYVMVTYSSSVLSTSARVLVYSGQYDFAANWIGGYGWVSQMSWEGQKAFNSSKPANWVMNGQVVGWSQSALNLLYVRVNNAGHMVPMNQPAPALDMISKFLKNQW